MTTLYPMIQQPVFKEKIWGGSKLARLMGKPLPEDGKTGESWEVADHPHGTSKVADGALSGRTLRQVVERAAEPLFGPGFPDAWRSRFPLLVKIIDASDDLSIQVHPDEKYIAKHGIRDSAKTECWVVLQADAGARLITGVKRGTDPEAFRRAAEQGDLERMLISREVRSGDVLLIPAGRLHAIGAGVLLAEFQQPSDTTYRVYDWGRKDDQGRSRELHLDQAVECIHFNEEFPGPGGTGMLSCAEGAEVRSLVECDKFYVHRATLHGGEVDRRLDHGFETVMITEGEGELAPDAGGEPMRVGLGQTVLLPAAAVGYRLRSAGRLVALLGGVPRP